MNMVSIWYAMVGDRPNRKVMLPNGINKNPLRKY